MSGQAWERGTDDTNFLHGMETKFTVLKNEDIRKLPQAVQEQLGYAIGQYRSRRSNKGKKENTYIMINTDEPYAPEVVEILKRYGHWG